MSYINNLNNELRYSYKKVLRRDLVEIKVSRKYKQSGLYGGIKDRNDAKLDSSLRRAKRRIIDIIDYNLVPNSIMVTLTYKENFQDYEKSYHHFRNFIKRLNMPKYLQVQELQQRGAIHYHVIIFQHFTNEQINEAWKQGFTYTKTIYDLNNNALANYFAKYVSELSKNQTIAKNKRLFNCSRDCLRPIEKKVTLYDTNNFIENGVITINTTNYTKYVKPLDIKDI